MVEIIQKIIQFVEKAS